MNSTGFSTAVDTTDIEKSKHVDPTMEKHAHDADEAMKAIDEMHGETIELDEATNRRLLRIIDWHMMPIMCFIYGMNYLDSAVLSLLPTLEVHLINPQRQHYPTPASWESKRISTSRVINTNG